MTGDATLELGAVESTSARCLLPAVLLVLSLAPAVAQESTFADTVQVDLIEVDALVTDAAGRPVLDLTVEDFQLFDNGEPVAITHFAPPAGAPASVARATGGELERSLEPPPSPSATPPRLVIFLDELHLTLRSRHLVLARLQEVLEGELPPGTEILLASYDGSVRVVAPFTTRRKELVKLLMERLSEAAQATADKIEMESLMRQLPEIVAASLAPPDYMESACETASGAVRGQAHQILGRVAATVGALGQFVRSLAVYPGPKSLLYVSDGLPLVAGQEIYDYLIELCDGSLTSTSGDPTLQRLAEYEPARRFPMRARVEMAELGTHDLWSELAAEANTRRVTLDTVQASGLEPGRGATVDGARTSSTTQTFGRRNLQEPLLVMAEETGGRAILNSNNVAPAVAALIGAESARYVLAFPSQEPVDGKTHHLRLEVSRPDLETRYRRSYKSRSPDERVVDGVLASLHHGLEDNPGRVRVAAERLDEDRVTLEVRVPLRSLVLLPEGAESRGLFTVFIAALDSTGIGTGIREKSVALRSGPDGAGKSHTVNTVLDLKSSRGYVVAVAVRDELGGSTSFTTTRVPAD